MLSKTRFKLFMPILAGATLLDRMVGCVGALLGIGLTGLICGLFFGNGPHLPLLVAPMGASAVLLFAVPSSPLAQPWPIIGGNTLSALVGVLTVRLIPDPALAAAAAVGLAIAVMSLLRCLHPPGGAAALTAVLGGPSVWAAGTLFPFVPVALNSAILVLSGWLFHRLWRRHAYPHIAPLQAARRLASADIPPQNRVGFRPEDVDKALEDLGETFDIARDDVDRLLRQVELRAFNRSHGSLRCGDIMSKDIIRIGDVEEPGKAKQLLLDHGMRTLPVVDRHDRVVGTVGLRELARAGPRIRDLMSEAWTAKADAPAVDLIGPLTDGRTHAVVIVDDQQGLHGMVTQTDLLAALARLPHSSARNPA